MFRFGRSRRADDARTLYDPRELLRAYERRATHEIRPTGELLIGIPLRDESTLEITVADPTADWVDSRVRGLCASLGELDRRAQHVLRGEFGIGWVELYSADRGTVDYWAIGVNSEYPVDIAWTGDGWAESPAEPG